MLYMEGITKIFRNFQGFDLDECKSVAYKSGYEALSFNGEIYVCSAVGNNWVKTPFIIQDFGVTL